MNAELNLPEMDGSFYIVRLPEQERSLLLALVIHHRDSDKMNIYDYNMVEGLISKLKVAPPQSYNS